MSVSELETKADKHRLTAKQYLLSILLSDCMELEQMMDSWGGILEARKNKADLARAITKEAGE